MLACQYGRHAYRRITALLEHADWRVGMERIWRRKGLKILQKQNPRGQLWCNDGSCVPVLCMGTTYEAVTASACARRVARTLNLIDKHTREALVVHVE